MSCRKPLFPITIDMKMIFNSHVNKTHFHKKGFALSLVLKVRVCRTRKSPIAGLSECTSHFNVILILEWASESGNSFPYFFDLIRSLVFPGSKPLNKRVGVLSYLITVKIYTKILEMPLKKRAFWTVHFLREVAWVMAPPFIVAWIQVARLHHMRVAFVVASRLCSERFFLGNFAFPSF